MPTHTHTMFWVLLEFSWGALTRDLIEAWIISLCFVLSSQNYFVLITFRQLLIKKYQAFFITSFKIVNTCSFLCLTANIRLRQIMESAVKKNNFKTIWTCYRHNNKAVKKVFFNINIDKNIWALRILYLMIKIIQLQRKRRVERD